MKKLKFKFARWLFTAIVLIVANQGVQAQCLEPSVLSDRLCANAPVEFKNEAKGAKNIVWDFGDGTIDNSGKDITSHPYSTPGTYNVTITYTDASGNPCTQTIQITILPPPELDVDVITPRVQCFAGNKFTVIDNSTAAPGSFIKRVKYVAAGIQVEQQNPTMPFSFDFSTADPGGNYYSIDIEIEDANGCIVVKTLQDYVEVKPSLGLAFTSDKPKGCDSTEMIITNNSLIDQGAIASFKWDFGDGTYDEDNWGPTIKHMYYLQGPLNGAFKTCLTVTDTTGCKETECFDASATNLIPGGWIETNYDSACMPDQPIEFYLRPHFPTGATSFFWIFGDPDSGPDNVSQNDPEYAEHNFTKPGPFLVQYSYSHPICGDRKLVKQVQLLGPVSSIPGPAIPLDERYQCRSEKVVHFPNESSFFHNDRKFFNDAQGHYGTIPAAYDTAYTYFDSIQNKILVVYDTIYDTRWVYHFDSTDLQALVRAEDDSLPNRGKDCVFRIWDFDDDYAQRCTTDTKAGKNVGMNCNFSLDSLPEHKYTDWEDIFRDSFYLKNQPFQKTIIVKGDTTMPDGCYKVQVDTSDLEEYRRLFYLETPRCFNVKLYHKDTCHPYECSSQAITQISIMHPRASGIRKEGRYCFGGPPNFGITFILEGTQPGCTANEVYINSDTATYDVDDPASWQLYTPGGLSGKLPQPAPIMPYDMSGPYPNEMFKSYPNAGSIKDTLTGYAHVGFIIGNGVGSNKCYDTAYYDSFIKFPVIDAAVEILVPEEPIAPRLYKICKDDSIVIHVNKNNITIPYDADQIIYSLQRISPSDVELGGRFPHYNYSIIENYEWFVPGKDAGGNDILENYLNREVVKVYGAKDSSLFKERFKVGEVSKWIKHADISQVFDILEPAFDGLGFYLATMTDAEIAAVFDAGCIDTTGIGQFIDWYVFPLERTSMHYRDTSIYGLDTYINDPSDYEDNAYTIIPDENGVYDLTFTVRSQIGGCLVWTTNRFIVGFYNELSVTDSIICKETEITGTTFFRYFHVDPENNIACRPQWMDCTDWWTDRANEAGQPGIEGFTKWDWDDADDDSNNPETMFADNNSGTNPYGEYGYGDMKLGGTGTNVIYYKDSGIYNLRVAASDSTGCKDTLSQNIYVTRLFSNFGFKDTLNACVNIVTFFDSTELIDPCIDRLGRKCDEIKEWYIDWGDGKQPDLFNKNTYPPYLGFNIGHNYTRAGTFEVKLRVKTDLGCEDSITKIFVIAGPIPEFYTDLQEVCSGDSITFFNTSDRITNSSQWTWFFGDGLTESEKAPDQRDSFKHEYLTDVDTTYYVYLTMYDSVAGRFCGFTYPDTIGGSQPVYEIKVIAKSPLKLTADKDTICPGDIVTFTVNGDPDYINFSWNFDANVSETDTLLAPDTIQQHQFYDIGLRYISVVGFMDPNLVKCPDADTISIYVDSVKANFEIDSSKLPIFCFTNTSTNAVKSRWGFYHYEDITEGSGEPFKEVIESDDEVVCNNYVDSLGKWFVCLIVENAGGCEDTICKEVAFFTNIYIPNVFTPSSDGNSDGDGYNDVFDIPINGHEEYNLTIRNRWGDVVFKSDDADYDWNGRVNNTGALCPDGQYIYQLKYRFKGMEDDEVSGIVVLIREK